MIETDDAAKLAVGNLVWLQTAVAEGPAVLADASGCTVVVRSCISHWVSLRSSLICLTGHSLYV